MPFPLALVIYTLFLPKKTFIMYSSDKFTVFSDYNCKVRGFYETSDILKCSEPIRPSPHFACALSSINRSRNHLFFDLADLFTLSNVAPALIEHWGVKLSTIADITAASFLGMFLGASLGGRLSDRIGRKKR